MPEVEITTEQNNCSDDVQSSDCISVLLGNKSISILGPYPVANSQVKSQDSYDMHYSKTSTTDDHQEDSASNRINEETSHPAWSIHMAEQQASSLVSANKIDGHVFDDAKETDISIKKSIFTVPDEPSRCVTKWVDAESAPFICSVLNPAVTPQVSNQRGCWRSLSQTK
jgi:hypothetical protein